MIICFLLNSWPSFNHFGNFSLLSRRLNDRQTDRPTKAAIIYLIFTRKRRYALWGYLQKETDQFGCAAAGASGGRWKVERFTLENEMTTHTIYAHVPFEPNLPAKHLWLFRPNFHSSFTLRPRRARKMKSNQTRENEKHTPSTHTQSSKKCTCRVEQDRLSIESEISGGSNNSPCELSRLISRCGSLKYNQNRGNWRGLIWNESRLARFESE
jgi:hypothetical protein